jgi:choline kinase
MEAIILASGIGKRLGNLGKKQPKCMLNLKKNIKIIDKLINDLEGINKINIVIGYKKNDLKNHLSKHKKKIRFIYNKHFKDKGNFYSVLICKDKITDSIILLDADIVLPKNTLKEFIDNKEKNLLMVNPKNSYNQDDILVNLNKKNYINKIFIKKKVDNSNIKFSSAGVIKMSRQTLKVFFSELNRINKSPNINAYYEDSYKNLFTKVPFKIFTLLKERLEIDTINDYKNLKKVINKNNAYI